MPEHSAAGGMFALALGPLLCTAAAAGGANTTVSPANVTAAPRESLEQEVEADVEDHRGVFFALAMVRVAVLYAHLILPYSPSYNLRVRLSDRGRAGARAPGAGHRADGLRLLLLPTAHQAVPPSPLSLTTLALTPPHAHSLSPSHPANGWFVVTLSPRPNSPAGAPAAAGARLTARSTTSWRATTPSR
jgi:hypothetical protein